MPTGYGKHYVFDLFAPAITIKKVCERQHSDTVVICLLTSIIQDQVKEEKSLVLDCTTLSDVKEMSKVPSRKHKCYLLLTR